jgi:hypothetical protein
VLALPGTVVVAALRQSRWWLAPRLQELGLPLHSLAGLLFAGDPYTGTGWAPCC